jgi:glutathione peroxidase
VTAAEGAPWALPLTTLDGRTTSLAEWRGQVLLIVNVASRCVHTSQYGGLEALWRAHRAQGLAVLGFPCDQFGHQEPGNEAEIAAFCQREYDVSFPMFAKVEVNGPGTHPLYRWLKRERPGILWMRRIQWNFTKFLVDRSGQVRRRYAQYTLPERVARDILPLLA